MFTLTAGLLVLILPVATVEASVGLQQNPEIAQVQALLAGPETTAANAQIESLLNMLQLSDDAANELALLELRIAAHHSMLIRYKIRHVDAGIRKHATWLVSAERLVKPDSVLVSRDTRFSRDDPAYRRKIRSANSNAFVDAYVTLIRSCAVAGDLEQARQWIAEGERRLHDIPAARDELRRVAATVSKLR